MTLVIFAYVYVGLMTFAVCNARVDPEDLSTVITASIFWPATFTILLTLRLIGWIVGEAIARRDSL